jgi:hypothetical protein
MYSSVLLRSIFKFALLSRNMSRCHLPAANWWRIMDKFFLKIAFLSLGTCVIVLRDLALILLQPASTLQRSANLLPG